MSADEMVSPELDPKNLTHVKLPVFEGPLDLLLYLIKKDEIDIYDIPIERITSQYLDYLRLIKMLDLEVAGEYLVVAATLVYIKSRVILPHDQRPPEDEVEEDDPRWELVRQLVEYKKYKDAAFELQQCLARQENVHGRGGGFKPDVNADGGLPFDKVGLFDLLSVFQKVLARANTNEDLRDIFEDRFTVSDKIQFIQGRLTERSRLVFEEQLQPAQVFCIKLAMGQSALDCPTGVFRRSGPVRTECSATARHLMPGRNSKWHTPNGTRRPHRQSRRARWHQKT